MQLGDEAFLASSNPLVSRVRKGDTGRRVRCLSTDTESDCTIRCSASRKTKISFSNERVVEKLTYVGPVMSSRMVFRHVSITRRVRPSPEPRQTAVSQSRGGHICWPKEIRLPRLIQRAVVEHSLAARTAQELPHHHWLPYVHFTGERQ